MNRYGVRHTRPGPKRGLRAAGWAAILITAAAIALAFGARARAGEIVEHAGALLLRNAHENGSDAPQILRINGLPLRMTSSVARQSVHSLLDGFEERCGLRRGAGRRSASPIAALRHPGAIADELLRPVLRADRADGGYLACLNLRTPELTAGELLRRVQAFADGGDLAALGDLRFVWAWRSGADTAYVAVWSEGPVRLAQLFPARGDAPGMDLLGIPRPPQGRRVLSAWQDEHAPMLASYRVGLAPSDLAARYRRSLIDGGFAVRDDGRPASASRWLLASRGGAFTAIAIDGEALQSIATLLPLR